MGRAIKFEFIADERVRRQTYRKRRAGLMKKVSELKTLCSVDACAVMYSPFGAEPDVYPSPSEAYHVLQRFNNLPILKKRLSTMNREGFLRKNIARVTANINKLAKRNWQVEMEQLMGKKLVENNLRDVVNLKDLKDVSGLLERRIKSTAIEIENIKRVGNDIGTGSGHA